MSAYIIDPTDPSFTQILNRVLFDTTISMGARLTYAALVEHYRDNGSCWPSMARLASMVGVTARTIQTYIKELASKGLLTVIKRGCWRKANEYRLHALVSPKTAPASQPAPNRDMRKQGAGDMRKPPYFQPYQTNKRHINFGGIKVKPAGAAAFIERELARRAAKQAGR